MNDEITVSLTYSHEEAAEVSRAILYFTRNVTATREDHDRLALVRSAIKQSLPPPKPDEPLALGAVVIDDKGKRWVRASDEDPEWRCETGRWGLWCDIDVVRKLSEGVTP